MKFLKIFQKQKYSAVLKKRKQNSYSLLLRKKRQKVSLQKSRISWKRIWSLNLKKYSNIAFGILVGCTIFLILGGFFFFSNFFTIKDILLTRRDFRVNVQGVSSVLKTLQGENVFLTSKKEITESLSQKFPEIHTIEITKIPPSAIRITVATFPIVAKWEFELAEKSEDLSENLIVFINTLGQVSPTEEGDEETAFHIIEKSKVIPTGFAFGTSIYPRQNLEKILETKELLEAEIPYSIDLVHVFRDAQEIHFITKDGPEFWMDFATFLEDQIQKIPSALQETDIFAKNILYLDLRIPDKIFIKEKS